MTNYTSWPMILPNMKAIRQMISVEQDSQSTTMLQMHENSYNDPQKSHSANKDAGRTNKRTNVEANGKRAVSPHTIICGT